MLGAGLAAALMSIVGPAQAEPITPEDVEAAFHEVEVVAEQVNQLDEDIEQAQSEIDDLTADIEGQLASYEKQRSALSALIVQEQMDAPLGTTVSLFGSEDPEEFLDGLGAVQTLSSTRADQVAAYAEAARSLENRRSQLEDRKAALAEDRDAVEAKRAEMEAGYEEAKAELARLSEPEQEEFNSSETEVGFEINATGRPGDIIAFAQAQLGDPYVYGGTGPDGWDCSGLVQASYAAGGVSLPRVVGAQYSAVNPVPLSQVQPGDIVFYGDMSHNGLYIGNGQVIHAPRPGKTVEVTSLSYGFSKAGRL